MENNQDVININTKELAEKLGIKPKKRTLGNGKVVEQIIWDKEYLLKAIKEVKPLSETGRTVRIDGPAPVWLVAALTHTVQPCTVCVYVPQIGKDVQIEDLKHGEENPEGKVKFKVIEKGNSVLIEYEMDLSKGVDLYDENNLKKIVVPEISNDKAVYISGRGPNYLTASIAKAYSHKNSSVSLNQQGTGYICSITHSKSKSLGDMTKDPIGKEEIKEKMRSEKETIKQL